MNKLNVYGSADRYEATTKLLKYELPNIAQSITPTGAKLMQLQYLSEGETVSDRLYSACAAFSSDAEHAIRLAYYIKKGWFMFATPLLANGGRSVGLPISCFLNHVEDSKEGLAGHYTETMFMAMSGGGVGARWSDVRSRGQTTSNGCETPGTQGFLKVADSLIATSRQGTTRKGAYAAYMHVSHPEIREFLRIRSADGGDEQLKSYNIHIGVTINNNFLYAVEHDLPWVLSDPHSNRKADVIPARELWGLIIKSRMTDRGEPYIFNEDVASNQHRYKDADTKIKASNLCTEITLKTSSEESAVCCLSSVNMAKYDEWMNHDSFLFDLVMMLDNTLDVFINNAPAELYRATRTAFSERSIGLGLMGYHTYMQSKGETYWYHPVTQEAFKSFCNGAKSASLILAEKRGAARVSRDGYRNTHVVAIAPNASSSVMLGVSPGIEPWRSNVFTLVQGRLVAEVISSGLKSVLKERYGSNQTLIDADIDLVRRNGGSASCLEWLSESQRRVLDSAHEIDQRDLIIAARERQLYVCQAQSLNLFFTSDADPRYVNDVHRLAFSDEEGDIGSPLPSLYYLQTVVDDKIEDVSILPAENGHYDTAVESAFNDLPTQCSIANKDECLACQG